MFCPRCGRENHDTNGFCHRCGCALQTNDAGSPPPVYGPPVYGYYPPPPPSEGHNMAVASFACGMVGFFLSGTGIIGLVMGIIALVMAKKAERLGSKDWMATVGKVLGIVSLVFGILMMLYVVFIFYPSWYWYWW